MTLHAMTYSLSGGSHSGENLQIPPVTPAFPAICYMHYILSNAIIVG